MPARRSYLMDTNRILAELRAERDRIDQAISALEGVTSTVRRRAGRPPRVAATRRRHGRMSAAARRKLSRLLKQRWAAGKMKPRAKAKSASKPRRMSRAARKKIAAAQRARWAKVKAQQRAQTKVA
jgi:hypothetical protein